jgi:hypothetical protein
MEHMKTSKTILAAIAVVTMMPSSPAYADAELDASLFRITSNYPAELTITRPHAEQGEAWAQIALGTSYLWGAGVVASYSEAIKWFKLSAAQGNPEGQTKLGFMYYKGWGVLQDYKESAKWYRRAAVQGHSGAQMVLGEIYENGMGVPIDFVRAHMWYNLGEVELEPSFSALKSRDKLASKMTPAQISEAQKLARECQARKFEGC